MSETGSLVKIVIILGIVMILVGLLYPGQDAGWTTFTKQISNFPVFNDPYAKNTISEVRTPVGDDYTSSHPGAFGCGANELWRCASLNDQNGSYVILNLSQRSVKLNLSALSAFTTQVISNIIVSISCSSIGAAKRVMFQLAHNPTTAYVYLPEDQNANFFCPQFPQFGLTRMSMASDLNGNAWNWSAIATGNWIVVLDNTGPGDYSIFRLGGEIEIGYVQAEIFFVTSQGPCPPNSWSDPLAFYNCEGGRFFQSVVKIFQFLLNGIVFIGSILVWFGGVIYYFGAMLLFFFSIPGAPPIIQNIVTVFIVGAGFMFLIKLLSIVRGSGSGV